MNQSVTVDKNRRTLLEWGWVLIIFAITDLVQIAGNFAMNWVETGDSIINYPVELVRSIVLGILGVVGGLFLLAFALQVYIGSKAVRISKEPDTSYAHIRIAWVLFAWNGFLLITSVLGILDGSSIANESFSIFASLIDMGIMYFFADAARKVRKDFIAAEKGE